jgi:histidyl-tRNA synthetase
MKFQAIKGVRDILPPESALWNRVEQAARDIFQTYGYGEIRLPEFELARLFERGVGGETDIVTKELYSWIDSPKANRALKKVRDKAIAAAYRADHHDPAVREELLKEIESGSFDALNEANRISLRPEATASVVRAYIQNGMHTWPAPVKLYYIGPMFRRERPQKGRYRQFYQIGAELLGPSDDASYDAEVIEMLMAFFERIRLTGTTLFINSIGDKNCRPAYVERLRDELRKVSDKLGADSQRRIETNPLRVLDSKIPEEQIIIEELPRIGQYLCTDCEAHYAKLTEELSLRGIAFQENWRLVRGLDYYMRTTFEITAAGLGSQNAVCGGGRYDGLVELLGGPAATKGIGFAIGTDRVVLSLQSEQKDVGETSKYELAVVGTTSGTWNEAVRLAESLRKSGAEVFLPRQGIRLKQALEQAAKFGVRVAIIVGEDELKDQRYTIRVMQPFYEGGERDGSIAVSRAPSYAALVQVRSELERKLKSWAVASGLAPSAFGISSLLNLMMEQQLLPAGLSAAIKDVLPTLNTAAHGEAIDDTTLYWALAFGYLLLAEVDKTPPLGKTSVGEM